MKRILAIPGSLRLGSYNRRLLLEIAKALRGRAEVEIFDLHPIPMYNQDMDVDGGPEVVRDLKRRVAEADAVIFATPEYNGSVPGVLKNAIDWLSRPAGQSVLRDKPVAILGASTGRGATQRAQEHLRFVLSRIGARVFESAQVQMSGAGERFAEDGSLADEVSREQLRAFTDGVLSWLEDEELAQAG